MRHLCRIGVMMLGIVACSDATAPARDISIDVALSTTSFQAGQTVTVDLTITNHGSQTRSVTANDCPEPFDVLDEAGAVVGPGPRVCSLALTTPIELTAGASVVLTRPWNGDASAGPADEPVFLAPGTYALRGYAYVGDDKVQSANEEFHITP